MIRQVVWLILIASNAVQGFQHVPLRCNNRCIISSAKPSQQEEELSTKRPVDAALSLLISDTGSVVLGSAGLVALVLARFSSDDTDSAEALTSMTRATLLAVLSIGAVLLNGLSQLDVPTALAETVELEGITIPETILVEETTLLADPTRCSRLSWALESLVRATPAATAVLIERMNDASSWRIMAAVGVLPKLDIRIPTDTPILDRFRTVVNGESYLPTLQALPGKTEFTYVPKNAQAALITSPRPNTVVVLASNQARSFTPRDIAWCQAVVSRVV